MSFIEDRNPFFNVRKEKIATVSGIEIPNKVALVNEDLNSVVGFVSSGYDVVHNETISNLFGEALNDLKVAKIIDHLDGTTKRWKRQLIFDDGRLTDEITSSDIVGVLLEIYNGYDGRTAYGYSIMGYRWLCSNGLVMGKKEIFSESFAHYDGNVDKLRQSFGMKFNAFHKNANTWREWSRMKFDENDFASFVEKHTKPENGRANKNQYLTPKISKGIIESYQPLIEGQGLDRTKWGAFNVFTWLATHETKARNGSNLFSNRYRNINRLAGDFYSNEETKSLLLT
jgi:hypothetical protein